MLTTRPVPATDRCAGAVSRIDPRAAIKELTALGVESQASLGRDEPAAVSIRLNSRFVSIVEITLTNEQSQAPAMATAAAR